jgi:hypothetical protein
MKENAFMERVISYHIFKQPRFYASKLDEDAYFRWIQEIPGVASVEQWPSATREPLQNARLKVGIDMKKFDQWSLRELLALYYRFDLEFEELLLFANADNKHWFYDTEAFWASRLPKKAP